MEYLLYLISPLGVAYASHDSLQPAVPPAPAQPDDLLSILASPGGLFDLALSLLVVLTVAVLFWRHNQLLRLTREAQKELREMRNSVQSTPNPNASPGVEASSADRSP